MNIELKEITVKELTEKVSRQRRKQVVGLDGKLKDIRPPYQREFVYGERKTTVIDALTKDFPLNVMYWAVRRW